MDCRKLDGTDQDKNLEIHVGRNSRITKSILGSKDYHRAAQSSIRGNITIPLSQERPDRDLRERAPQFFCTRRVVVKYVESLRQISLHSVSRIHLSERDFWKDTCA